MMDNYETSFVSSILERTPKAEPYYSEVRHSIDQLRQGDPSHNPLYGIIHGHIGALAEKGGLGSDWITRRVSGGVVVPHKDFLRIQDEFTTLENESENSIPWNANLSLEALGSYIGRMQKYRSRHRSFFQDGLRQLTEKQSAVIQQRLQNHKNLISDTDNFIMVALPSHLDNPKLWETFNLRGSILDRIGPLSKINEQGVILASRAHRNDNPRGHDYFSYAAKAVRNGEAKTMSDKLMLTAQHEGSHGITDALLIDLLKLDAYNPVYEGLAGALGEDGRETKPSIAFAQFLKTPYPADSKQRMDNAYYSGSRYWESLRRVLQKRDQTDQVWSTIFGIALGAAVDINNKPKLMSADAGSRISKFLLEVPNRLGVNMGDLETEYNAIAENK